MKFLATAAFGLAILTGAPASATSGTYSAFDAFTTASATSGPFSFGSVSGGIFTAYPTGGTCLLANVACLTSGDYLGAYKSFDGAAHPGSGTIDVPSDALIFHPGRDGQIASVFFTAAATGFYDVKISAFQATNVNANSVSLIGFNSGISSFSFGNLTAASPSFQFQQIGIFIGHGQSIGFGIGNGGDYSYDSTGVNFTVSGSTVPEPASWALMIGGFAMTGFAMRRRATLFAA